MLRIIRKRLHPITQLRRMQVFLWDRRWVMERRRFTREFKLEAVRLIRDRGVSYAQPSEDLTRCLRNRVQAILFI
jgi:transposase-like protein